MRRLIALAVVVVGFGAAGLCGFGVVPLWVGVPFAAAAVVGLALMSGGDP